MNQFNINRVRSARIRGVKKYLRAKLIDEQKTPCAHCGSTKDLTLDHIVPIGRGGRSNTTANFQVLCKPCNKKKADSLDIYKGIPEGTLRYGLTEPLRQRFNYSVLPKNRQGLSLSKLNVLELGSILHRLSLMGQRTEQWAKRLSRIKAIKIMADEMERRILQWIQEK